MFDKQQTLLEALKGKVPEVHAIGACKEPGSMIVDAVEGAAEVALSL